MQIVYTGSEFYFAHAQRKFVKVVLYQKIIGLATLTIVESFMLVSGIAQSWLLAAQLYWVYANIYQQVNYKLNPTMGPLKTLTFLYAGANARLFLCFRSGEFRTYTLHLTLPVLLFWRAKMQDLLSEFRTYILHSIFPALSFWRAKNPRPFK